MPTRTITGPGGRTATLVIPDGADDETIRQKAEQAKAILAQQPEAAPSAGPRAAGLASDVLQVGVPLALRAAGMVRNPLLLGATALASRVLPSLISRPAGETVPHAAEREVKRGAPTEALALLPPGVGLAARMAAPRALPALTTAAERIGLPAARTALSEGAQAVARRFPATGTAAMTLRRVFGAMFVDPEAGPVAVRSGLRGLLRGLSDTERDTVMAKVLAAADIHLGKITSSKLGQLIRTDPQRVVRAIRVVEAETGVSAEPLLRTVRQTLVSRAAQRALRVPASKEFPGAFRGGELDRATLLSELGALRKSLGDGLDTVFGREGVRGLDELSRVLAGPAVQRGVARAPVSGLGETPRLRAGPLIMALTGYMVGGRMGEALEIAGGTTFAFRDARDLLRGLLSTPAGMRYLAAGIDLQTRGVPDRLLVPALARLAPHVLASFGVGSGIPLPDLAAPGVTGAFVGGLTSLVTPREAAAAERPLEEGLGVGGTFGGIPGLPGRTGPVLQGAGAASLPTQITPSPFATPPTPEQLQQMEILRRLPELLRLFFQSRPIGGQAP